MFTLVSIVHGQSKPRDGNYWRELNETEKTFYALGLFDGTDLGGIFAMKATQEVGGDSNKMGDAYSSNVQKYEGGVTIGQMMSGMNSFYEDYRNRSIAVINGAWVVLRGIKGESQASLDSSILFLRKNAVPPNP
jgi:hypothetical protein